jgi:hypothetical protein
MQAETQQSAAGSDGDLLVLACWRCSGAQRRIVGPSIWRVRFACWEVGATIEHQYSTASDLEE